MSSEIETFSAARNAYNVLNNTGLEAHSGNLNAEQAEQINNHYDIEVHGGTHGIISEAQENPYAISLPTQKEYEEAARVIEDMQPGDTLFREAYRLYIPHTESPFAPDRLPTVPQDGSVDITAYNHAVKLRHEEQRSRLEKARREYKMNAWTYAENLALLKGIDVVYADHDAFEDETFRAMSGDKGLLELTLSPDEQENALAWRMHAQRERKATNIVKDWALDHLPTTDTPAPNARKPKLVLLFGSDHLENLEQRFDDLGLDAKFIAMGATDMPGRAQEQLGRIMNDAMAMMMGQGAIIASSILEGQNMADTAAKQSLVTPHDQKSNQN